MFLSDELSSQIRESGTATVTLTVKVDKPTADFQARIVDYTGGSGFIVSRTEADLGHYKSLTRTTIADAGQVLHADLEHQHRRPDVRQEPRPRSGHHGGAVEPDRAVLAVKATIDTQKSSLTMPLSGDAKSLQSAGQVAPDRRQGQLASWPVQEPRGLRPRVLLRLELLRQLASPTGPRRPCRRGPPLRSSVCVTPGQRSKTADLEAPAPL